MTANSIISKILDMPKSVGSWDKITIYRKNGKDIEAA